MGFLKRLALPYCYKGILELVTLSDVVMSVVSGNHWYSGIMGQGYQPLYALRVFIHKVLL